MFYWLGVFKLSAILISKLQYVQTIKLEMSNLNLNIWQKCSNNIWTSKARFNNIIFVLNNPAEQNLWIIMNKLFVLFIWNIKAISNPDFPVSFCFNFNFGQTFKQRVAISNLFNFVYIQFSRCHFALLSMHLLLKLTLIALMIFQLATFIQGLYKNNKTFSVYSVRSHLMRTINNCKQVVY